MTKYFAITKTSIIVFIVTFILAFFASLAHAENISVDPNPDTQNDQLVVQKYRISFPVADLGNCNSITECKSYCSDATHQTACINFAKAHGFYKQNQDDQVLSAAKTELGCDSKEACQAFCGQQEHWQACGDFARKYHLGGQKPEASSSGQIKKEELLQKAQQFLGCSSLDSCKGFCTQPQNQTACQEFARVIGLQSGAPTAKPEGCTSAMCRAYCDKNPDQCRQFSAGAKDHMVPNQLPPRPNTAACRNLKEKLASGSAIPQELKTQYVNLCLQNPYSISTKSGVTSVKTESYCIGHPAECGLDKEAYCRQYPQNCQVFSPTPITKEDFCRQYPDKCNLYSAPPQPTAGTESNIKGIATANNLIQNILHFFGF